MKGSELQKGLDFTRLIERWYCIMIFLSSH